MLLDDLRNFAKTQCGDPMIGIAPVDDLTPKEAESVKWTNQVLSKYSPIYSPDTPVLHPRDFLETAQSIVVIGHNFFFGRNDDLPGNPPKTSFMNFYINPDVLDYVVTQTDNVIEFLKKQGYEGVLAANGLPIKLMSSKSSLGSYGKNAVIHNPTLGSWIGLTMVITDAPFEIDSPAKDYCAKCTLCIDACPTKALETPYKCDIEKCITLHMVNNKFEIPNEIRENSGMVIAQCEICLDACPHNKNLTVQKSISIPENVIYHELAPLLNMSDNYFEKIFGSSFLEFMIIDKKYLQRNAAIALGNYGDSAYVPELVKALETQPEEIIRTSTAWALGKIGSPNAKAALDKYRTQDPSKMVRQEIETALSRR